MEISRVSKYLNFLNLIKEKSYLLQTSIFLQAGAHCLFGIFLLVNSFNHKFLSIVPPEFVVRPVNQTSVVSSNFTLGCAASGDPAPAVLWLFNSSVLSNGAKYRILSNSLTVNNVVVDDAGWYTCRIVNVAGNQTAMAFVDVNG